ncbi:putative low-complexity protein [Leptolyngbya sp. PCC 7375]|nr:putative low-complexity protein [Leptolyngbya sp. PCC 7375]
MNLRTIRAIVSRRLRPTDKTETTRKIANRLHRNRLAIHHDNNTDGNWHKAERIRKNSVRRLLFWINQLFVCIEKRAVEPVANWIDRADFFRIIERLSPTIEALGVIAIPLVLFFATQLYQRSLFQQQAVTDYLNQLSITLRDSDLRDPQNEELRTLTTATTLTLLRDPNLDGARKGQVVKFLSQMRLINTENIPAEPIQGSQGSEEKILIISLEDADLKDVDLKDADLLFADLSSTDLSGADLSGAELAGADLRDADLWSTNLRSALLWGSNLRSANLRSADLRNANLKDANLRSADLRDANLKGADLAAANLWRANLESADLSGANLEGVYLCETKLPKDIRLDPNRDCETLKQLMP